MDQETQEWLNEQAKNYKACIIAVLKNIPPKLTEEMSLGPPELKDIAGTLYIQGQKAGVFRKESGAAPPRYEDDVPSTEKQQVFIGKLAAELGKDADNIVDQALRLAGVKTIDKLTLSEATELIKRMKQEKANRKKA